LKQVFSLLLSGAWGSGNKNLPCQALQSFSASECLRVLSLPVHCTAIGCTTIGQLDDDVRIAQQFKPYSADQMVALRERAKTIKGPSLEDWKRNVEGQVAMTSRQPYHGG
jgi:hypothetical protein